MVRFVAALRLMDQEYGGRSQALHQSQWPDKQEITEHYQCRFKYDGISAIQDWKSPQSEQYFPHLRRFLPVQGPRKRPLRWRNAPPSWRNAFEEKSHEGDGLFCGCRRSASKPCRGRLRMVPASRL